MTNNSNTGNTSNSNSIMPATLAQLHKLGFKLVPLLLKHNNKPAIEWTPIYNNPNYWTIEELTRRSVEFKNVATVFGKTHKKDSKGRDLYLANLDCDSEPVYKFLTTPIIELHEVLQLMVKTVLSELETSSSYPLDKEAMKTTTVLDILKQNTVVVKTRQPYGFQVYWFSHTQHPHVKNEKVGHEYEIKTDKSLGHATLPPSTHRNDKTFRYTDVGRTDTIAITDTFYNLVTALLEPITAKEKEQSKKEQKQQSKQKQRQKQQQQQQYYNLSNEMIETTISCFMPYYKEPHRNDFALVFSGAAWHSKISQESTSKILEEIATHTHDNEVESRLRTLEATYEKANKGEAVTGGPRLAELITQIKRGTEEDLKEIEKMISRVQTFWHDDIENQRKRQQKVVRDSKKVVSVSEAIRLIEGPLTVYGKVVGIGKMQPMISRLEFRCEDCHHNTSLERYISSNRQVWRSPIKDHSRCFDCKKPNTFKIVSKDHVTSLEIQLQDIEKLNDIEQLSAILFEHDTEGIQFNDILILKGNLHVVQKYDIGSNTLQSILFVESVQKQTKEEELENTAEDIERFKVFAKSEPEPDSEPDLKLESSNTIQRLAAMAAPLTVGNELAKKGLLIVAVNAGIPNDYATIPHRKRTNTGLIGDPGLAKSTLLKQFCELVSGSIFVTVQSSTAISLTVFVDKEQNGQRTVRPGPVVLASGAILGLDEFGQIGNMEDNKYFTNAAEEGKFSVIKYGVNVPVIAHPSIIITSNPTGGRWKNPEVIDEIEFPILTQFGDRLDFIIPFIEKKDETSIREFLRQRRELAEKLKVSNFEESNLWLKKYLLYAKTLKPTISYEIGAMLEDYLVEIVKKGVRGISRRIEALERTAIGFAKLKLKEDFVDDDDVNDTINFYNEILKFYKKDATTIPLRDLVVSECLEILKTTKPQEWKLDELIEMVCARNEAANRYIGECKQHKYNSKIRAIRHALEKYPNVSLTCQNPLSYTWLDSKNDNNSNSNNNTDTKSYNKIIEKSGHLGDTGDTQNKISFQKNNPMSSNGEGVSIL